MPVLLHPSEWINWPLLREPLNWAIVGVVATIWLMAFHTVMQGFTAMQGGGSTFGSAGPGTIAAPLASASAMFGTPGSIGPAGPQDVSSSWFGADNFWSDQFESKYAEDGWTGNS